MEPAKYTPPSAPCRVPAPVFDESKFRAGRLSLDIHLDFWEKVVLGDHPDKLRILDNMRGMQPEFRRFRGRFGGRSYDCNEPPPRVFRNNWPDGLTSTGQTAEEWALEKIRVDVASGALICVGKVGEVAPPRVVLPLSVEMAKPRLIHDARFTNCWCESRPFGMDRVGSIPETFQRRSFFSSYDHKSGYHHWSFAKSAQCYYGMEAGGRYYVPACGIFGSNLIPEIYHCTHAALLEFAARAFGIASKCYLDDAISGSMNGASGTEALRRSAAWSTEVLLWLNFLAGYTVSVKKSVLTPVQSICWLGIDIDSVLGTFSIPHQKKADFLALIDGGISSGKVSVRDLERIAGKGMSFMLAVGEAAKVFTREMFNVIASIGSGRTANKSTTIRMSPRLLRVFRVWSAFLNTFDGAPWYNTMHTVLRIETDASGRRYGGLIVEGGMSVLDVGEEFSAAEMSLHIEAKEALAVTKVIELIASERGWEFLAGKRIDAWIDNQPLVFAMAKGSSRMAAVHAEIEKLFWWKLSHHFTVNPIWFNTKMNARADAITRVPVDNDFRLVAAMFDKLWFTHGPFDMDLMASSISTHTSPGSGRRLRFFSQYLSPGTAGVNFLAQSLPEGAYFCFPPAALLAAAVCHLAQQQARIRVALVAALWPCAWLASVRHRLTGTEPLPPGSVIDHNGDAVSATFGVWIFDCGSL